MFEKAAFVFDIDDTLGRVAIGHGDQDDFHEPIFPLLTRWLERGADLVFVTSRARHWLYETVLQPIVQELPSNAPGRIFA